MRLSRFSRAGLAAVSALLLTPSLHLFAAPARKQMQATGYVISADLDPATNTLSATAAVTIHAFDDLDTATFELNSGLQVSKVVDSKGTSLTAERVAATNAPGSVPTVRVTLATPVAKDADATYTFTYSGALKGADTSPVEGIKLASVEDPISILLYPGRWFPMTGLFTDRFTAEMRIRVPADERVVGSGAVTTGGGKTSVAGGRTEYSFSWKKAGFPGTIVAGKFLPAISPGGINNIRVWVTEQRKDAAQDFGGVAERELEFMTSAYGSPESGILNIVQLPEDAVSAAWAPEVVAIKGSRIADHNSQRLLANTIAHQWFGSEVSPATLNDAWITNGMSRYAELMYVEDSAGKTALQNAIGDVSAGALAYDTEPLTTLGRQDPFSPQFQSMTLEKGAMVFHMLRYEMGDDGFLKFIRGLLSQYTDKGVSTAQFKTVAVAQSKLELGAFFSEWLDGTGAPQFGDKYTVFRLGNNKGFRTTGAITQDLDLFRMPVELRIETEGKTEVKHIEVSGTDSPFTVETFGRPRKITIDPDGWVLKSTPDLAVKVAVLRGQQQLAQGDLTAALTEYQKALDANRNSSLAQYRIGEVFYMQRNYQASANSFRDALRGDLDPRWVEVWSHVKLGCIFDVTGQRDRAVNEYRLAVQSNDNTQGALNEARQYMSKACKAPDVASN